MNVPKGIEESVLIALILSAAAGEVVWTVLHHPECCQCSGVKNLIYFTLGLR